MPKGIYERTELHRAICSKAGAVSASTRQKTFTCLVCGEDKRIAKSSGRQYCSVACHNTAQTHATPKTYGTIHAWIRRKFGTPSECEHCGTTESPKFEWANLTGKYLLLRSDWARLCCRCHRRYDLGVKNKIDIIL